MYVDPVSRDGTQLTYQDQNVRGASDSQRIRARTNVIYFPDEFAHEIESAWAYADNLPGVEYFDEFIDFRRRTMTAFAQALTNSRKYQPENPQRWLKMV
jgi:hypothetical protein